MTFLRGCFLLLALTFSDAAIAETPAKFALVIANSDYDGDGKVDTSTAARTRAQARGLVGDLGNPWFDAVRVGDALRGAGFEVDTVLNGDRASMYGAVMRLYARADAAGPSSSTVLFFAGHGVQIGGRNYLVATRARLSDEDLRGDTGEQRTRVGIAIGLSVQDILMQAHRPDAIGYNLIFLDACRDNPWESQIRAALATEGRDYVGERGFMAMTVMTQRTVLSFSAQPGGAAGDGIEGAGSPYGAALVGILRQPGITIDDAVTRLSSVATSVDGDVQQPWSTGRLYDNTRLR